MQKEIQKKPRFQTEDKSVVELAEALVLLKLRVELVAEALVVVDYYWLIIQRRSATFGKPRLKILSMNIFLLFRDNF